MDIALTRPGRGLPLMYSVHATQLEQSCRI